MGTGLRLLITAFTADQFPAPDRPEAVMSGRSNVGKSLLLNRLAKVPTKLIRKSGARVSSRPGCTRSVNFYDWPPRGRLVDLPGYGYAQWSDHDRRAVGRLVDAYLNERMTIAVLVHVADIRLSLQPTDWQLLEWSRARGCFHLLALNKCDKLTRFASSQRVKTIAAGLEKAGFRARCLPVSAADGTGVDILGGAIRQALQLWPKRSDDHAV
jgi:GTP-binding protein